MTGAGPDVVPFERRFAEPAAVLLAGDHSPGGVLDLCDVDVTRRLVHAWQGAGPAVAAVDDGTLGGPRQSRSGRCAACDCARPSPGTWRICSS